MHTNADLSQRYAAKTPGSAALYRRALGVIPGGVAHDSRYLAPHPLYVARAEGAHKWDVDGNRYIDYVGGHGALLLGHNHPVVAEAVREQLAKGTHYGGCHELEVAWAEQIRRLIPCAQRVRFTNSGTEATLLAIRLARAYTGRAPIVRLAGHFHGWHDQVAAAVTSHFDGTAPAGVLREVARQAIVCPPNDLVALGRILDEHDAAALILEPTGASFGHVPLVEGYLAQARELTARRGVLLIFDEVITGFRVSTGGAQAHYGVTPDLATLAKIVAGGLPGGAVVGRADVMGVMARRDDPSNQPQDRQWNSSGRVSQQGTFNANPLSAAAGLATLRLVAQGDVVERANRTGALLRERLNGVLAECGSSWLAYGEFSGFHLFTNPRGRAARVADIYAGRVPWEELRHMEPGAGDALRCGMIVGGVDIFPWPGGCVSAVHSEQDVETTAAALKQTWELFDRRG